MIANGPAPNNESSKAHSHGHEYSYKEMPGFFVVDPRMDMKMYIFNNGGSISLSLRRQRLLLQYKTRQAMYV